MPPRVRYRARGAPPQPTDIVVPLPQAEAEEGLEERIEREQEDVSEDDLSVEDLGDIRAFRTPLPSPIPSLVGVGLGTPPIVPMATVSQRSRFHYRSYHGKRSEDPDDWIEEFVGTAQANGEETIKTTTLAG